MELHYYYIPYELDGELGCYIFIASDWSSVLLYLGIDMVYMDSLANKLNEKCWGDKGHWWEYCKRTYTFSPIDFTPLVTLESEDLLEIVAEVAISQGVTSATFKPIKIQ